MMDLSQTREGRSGQFRDPKRAFRVRKGQCFGRTEPIAGAWTHLGFLAAAGAMRPGFPAVQARQARSRLHGKNGRSCSPVIS